LDDPYAPDALGADPYADAAAPAPATLAAPAAPAPLTTTDPYATDPYEDPYAF
jgi:hypothetical protein